MFVFGHIGIGLKLAQPLRGGNMSFAELVPSRKSLGSEKALSLPWIIVGTLLPDLIDKPLYYGLSWYYGLQGMDLGLICGTRTFGHTALLLLIVSTLAWLFRSRVLASIALGMSTHLVLDHLGALLGDLFLDEKVYFQDQGWNSSRLAGLLWPILGNRFPVIPYENLKEHLFTFFKPHVLAGECLGLFFILRDLWRSRKSGKRKLRMA